MGTVTCFEGVQRCRRLVEDAGLEVPSWRELAETPAARVEDPEPGQPKYGWQQKATRAVEQSFVHTQVWPLLNGPTRALLRSQHGSLASAPFTALPTSRGHQVRRATVPPSCFAAASTCPFPSLCAPADVAADLNMFWPPSRSVCRGKSVGKEGVSLWNVRPRRSVGKQEHEWPRNVWVRDMDLGEFNAFDGRRLEVVADGLSLWRGAQLAIDMTLVSPLSRRSCTAEGEKKGRRATYPELSGEGGSGTLGCIGSRSWWSLERPRPRSFLSALAKAKAQSAPHLLQGRVEAAWLRRWSATLQHGPFAVSLLDRRPVPGTGGPPFRHEGTIRFA